MSGFRRRTPDHAQDLKTKTMLDAWDKMHCAESPLGRIGQPRDTAALVSFLCSPQDGWINGQLLHSYSGLHA